MYISRRKIRGNIIKKHIEFKTYRLHHVESSSVHHISLPFASNLTLLTDVVLARDRRGSIPQCTECTRLRGEIKFTSSWRDRRRRRGWKIHRILLFARCLFSSVVLSSCPGHDPSSSRARPCASRESSRLLAIPRNLVCRVRSTD